MKTPGQVAYEAGSEYLLGNARTDAPVDGFEPWDDVSPAFKAYWEAIARAVMRHERSER